MIAQEQEGLISTMKSPVRIKDVDMNDPSNLALYNQLFLFRHDIPTEDILFENKSSSEQRTLLSLAHSLELDYEYSKKTRIVRVSRRETPMENAAVDATDSQDFEFLDFDSQGVMGEKLEDIFDITASMDAGDNLKESSMSTNQLDQVGWNNGSSCDLSTLNYNYNGSLDRVPSDFGTVAFESQVAAEESRPQVSEPSYDQTSLKGWSGFDSRNKRKKLSISKPPTCKSCRKRRIRCDGYQPTCTMCLSLHAQCCYVDPMAISKPFKYVCNFTLDPFMSTELRTSEGCTSSLVDPVVQYCNPEQFGPDFWSDNINLSGANEATDTDASRSPKGTGFEPLMIDTYDHSYGCTFLGCKKTFWRKNDWKRHENSQHFQLECWRCDKEKPEGGICAQIYYRRQNFQDHLKNHHQVQDTHTIEKNCEYCHIGRNCHGSFWCGFCGKIVGLRAEGFATWTERFDHIDAHFMGRPPFTKRNILDWIPCDGSQLKGEPESINGEVTPGYYVFDSNSACSAASEGSATSTASGRRGPLSEWAKAGMRAVKKVGACWRCKVLRKCDPESPCLLCPKGSETNWEIVGCKRGSLKSQMLPVLLCPRSKWELFLQQIFTQPQMNEIEFIERASICNTQAREAHTQRGKDILQLHQDYKNNQSNPLLQGDAVGLILSQNSSASSDCSKQPATLIPLNECILHIHWELHRLASSEFALDRSTENWMALMQEAALYQANVETDQLIAQSLICLRSCLEVLNLKVSGSLDEVSHGSCEISICKIECVAGLILHINLFLDELSRVFFKKDNMRHKGIWWLSAFYSFTIQSVVRRALIKLEMHALAGTNHPCLGSQQFLQLPLDLFFASACNHNYDPLVQAGPGPEQYQAAQRVVEQSSWCADGIQGSEDYLRKIFDKERHVGRKDTNRLTHLAPRGRMNNFRNSRSKKTASIVPENPEDTD